MNYYDTLGVGKKATQEEIKKAYRKLSMQYHPDRTGGDDTKFKEINEAYSVIGDEAKRRKYDLEINQRNAFNGFRTIIHPSDINMKMTVSIKDAYYGCKKGININGKNLLVDIPRGTTNGKILKISGKGMGGIDMYGNEVFGDLLLFITVENTYNMQLNSDGTVDVVMAIDWIDAILGGEKEMDFFDKKINVKIPQYTQNGGFVIIGGKGFPKFKSEECGNIKVNFIVKMPKKLKDSQLDLLKEIKKGLS